MAPHLAAASAPKLIRFTASIAMPMSKVPRSRSNNGNSTIRNSAATAPLQSRTSQVRALKTPLLLGGPRSWDSRSRFLRCNPAGFDIGSGRRRNGWFEASAVHFIYIKFIVGGGACGDVGEGEHFPAFRACSGSGGSAAGRQRRSSTYPQVFLVNVPRRAITQALVLALRVVKFQPRANAGLGFGHCRIGIEVDLLYFETAPQPLDEDVVHTAALTVHADRDTMPL